MAVEKRTRQRYGQRLWFVLHGWFSLPIWGVLLLTCVTGSLCVISQEITWLYNPEVRASPVGDEVRFDLMTAAIENAYPASRVESIQVDEPYLVYRMRIQLSSSNKKVLFVNPYTGALQGEADGSGFRGFVLALHGWLLLPWQNDYSFGWYLVTFLSIPLLGSLVTALVLFKRFWRLFYRPRLRWNKGDRVFWGDLHRLLGVWSIWFVAIISVSGLWFLIQGVLAQNQVELYPTIPSLSQKLPALEAPTKAAEVLPLDQLVTKAKAASENLNISFIQLPEHTEDVVVVQGTQYGSLFGRSVNAVYLNPYTGEPISFESPINASLLHAVVALMAPLHFGNFGGLSVKLIWFLFGLILCLIVGSGFVIWSKRALNIKSRNVRHERRVDRVEIKKDKGGSLRPVTWRGFAYVSWLFILLPLYFLCQ